MSAYLTEKEIERYCSLVAGVNMSHVEAASIIIDAYKGFTFMPTQHTERVDLNFKRSRDEVRGKLEHHPRLAIKSVVADVSTPFGRTKEHIDVSCMDFDEDTSQYFTFRMPRQLMFRKIPSSLLVTYVSGYDVIPEPVKRATGILACNIKQMGGVMRWKQRDDYDIKVTLSDQGVFTDEIKQILRGVSVR